MIDYENHPAAALFPMMTEAELRDLADDIEKNGLREPIQLLQGKILDGRNRFVACKKRAIEATFTNLNGNCPSPVGFVLSKNLHRRHLDTGQRAAIAAEALPLLIEEARKRQGSRTDLIEKIATSTSGRKRPDVTGRSAIIAGKLLAVGKTSVKIAARVKRQDAEIFDQLKRGEISIKKARKKLAGKGIRQGLTVTPPGFPAASRPIAFGHTRMPTVTPPGFSAASRFCTRLQNLPAICPARNSRPVSGRPQKPAQDAPGRADPAWALPYYPPFRIIFEQPHDFDCTNHGALL